MPEIADALDLQNKDIGSAFGQLSKEKILKMDSEKNVTVISENIPERIHILSRLLEKASGGNLLDEEMLLEEELAVLKANSKKGDLPDLLLRLSRGRMSLIF